jgi:simple sugar transport system substrate-binding protein
MFSKRTWLVVSVLVVLAMAMSACGQAATVAPTTAPATAASAATTAPAATEAATVAATIAPTATEDTSSCSDSDFCFGMLLVGPHTDNGWSTATYLGAQYVVSKIPGSKFIYAENVFSDPNTTVAQYAEKLLSRGAKVIVFNSDDMKDGLTEFAAAHPDVPVVWLSGDFAWKDGQRYQKDMAKESDIMGRMEFGKMIAGCSAALTTKTGKIGFLGALTNDETRRLSNAAYLGANYCWTKVLGKTTALDFKVTWIGYWFNEPGTTQDPTQVADDFFNSGYDVVMSGIDSTEAVTEAKKFRDQGKDVYAVQYDYEDACSVAPDACLGVPYYNWGVMMLPVLKSVKDGTYTRQFVYQAPDWKDINNADTSAVGFKKGAALSADNSKKLDSFIAELAGGLNLWKGPIKYQDGTVYLADGAVATDQQIWYMPQLLAGMTGESVSK